jgi:hypothetical protein
MMIEVGVWNGRAEKLTYCGQEVVREKEKA